MSTSTVNVRSTSEAQQIKINEIIEEINDEQHGGNFVAEHRLKEGNLHGAAAQLHGCGMNDLARKVEDVIAEGV